MPNPSRAYRNPIDLTQSPFNAVGDCLDGVTGTDNLPAFTKAIAYLNSIGGGKILLPAAPGLYGISDSIEMFNCVGIRIEGVSQSYDDTDGAVLQGGGIIALNSRDIFSIKQSRYLGFKHLVLHGNDMATAGFHVDRLLQFRFDDCNVIKCPGTGFDFTVFETITSDDFNGYSVITNCSTELTYNSVRLKGTSGSGTYHVTWINNRFNFGPGKGIRLINCDNNCFIQTLLNRDSGTDYGVTWEDDGSGNLPNSHYFLHLQASAGGIHFDDNVPYPGSIFGYDMSNGQPFPAIPVGCNVTIHSAGIGAIGDVMNIIYPASPRAFSQHALGITADSGVPDDTYGLDGWLNFRSDGVPGAWGYQRRSGHWAPLGPIVSKAILSGQHADIVSTSFGESADTGAYEISYYVQCTATDAGAGNLVVQFAWTDDVGLFTQDVTITLSTTTRTFGVIPIRSTAGSISYKANIASGSYGTSRYRLDLTLKRLS